MAMMSSWVRLANRIAAEDITVSGWIDLIRRGGFALVDVLLRDAEQVIIATLKSSYAAHPRRPLVWAACVRTSDRVPQ